MIKYSFLYFFSFIIIKNILYVIAYLGSVIMHGRNVRESKQEYGQLRFCQLTNGNIVI